VGPSLSASPDRARALRLLLHAIAVGVGIGLAGDRRPRPLVVPKKARRGGGGGPGGSRCGGHASGRRRGPSAFAPADGLGGFRLAIGGRGLGSDGGNVAVYLRRGKGRRLCFPSARGSRGANSRTSDGLFFRSRPSIVFTKSAISIDREIVVNQDCLLTSFGEAVSTPSILVQKAVNRLLEFNFVESSEDPS